MITSASDVTPTVAWHGDCVTATSGSGVVAGVRAIPDQSKVVQQQKQTKMNNSAVSDSS